MHARTQALDALMRNNGFTARQVGELVGRGAHTVRVWRCEGAGRVIPSPILALLQAKAGANGG